MDIIKEKDTCIENQKSRIASLESELAHVKEEKAEILVQLGLFYILIRWVWRIIMF